MTKESRTRFAPDIGHRATRNAIRGALAGFLAAWMGCAPGVEVSGTGGAATTSGSGGAGTGGASFTGGSSGSGGLPGSGGSGSGGSGSGGARTGGSATGGGLGGTGGAPGGTAGAAGRGGGAAGRSGPGGAAGGGSGGSTGTAGLGGPSLCTPGRYLLCEGFEGTPVGNTPPTGWTRTGAASVASDQAARGTNAMKIAAATNGARRFVYGDSESFGAMHWGRIFYRVQLPVPTPFVHSTLVELQGNGASGDAAYRVVDTVKNGDAAQMHQFLYNVQPSGAEFATGSPYNWKFDGMWHCAEWFVDATTQSYQFYFDGAEVTSIRIANANKRIELPMVFTSLSVGWNNYQAADPGFVAWIDEIAVATSRIGCGN